MPNVSRRSLFERAISCTVGGVIPAAFAADNVFAAPPKAVPVKPIDLNAPAPAVTINSDILKSFNLEPYFARMIEIRRTLHRRPEAGWTEFETTYLITNELKAMGLKVLLGPQILKLDSVMGRNPTLVEKEIIRAKEHGVPQSFIDKIQGYTGCIGILETGRPGPVIGMRFDIDCVQVQEKLTPDHVPFKEGFHSERKGLMHACGHDGHTAVGLTAARWAMKNKNQLCGTIKFVFQPAEEGVRGAGPIADSGILDDVDYFLGTHIGGVARLGEMGVLYDGLFATTKFDIEFTGKASHAGSAPQDGRNALMAACTAAVTMQGIPRNARGDTRVAVGTLHAGEGRNITPVHATMQMEVRGMTEEANDYMIENVNRIVKGVADAYEVKSDIRKAGEAKTLPRCDELLNRLAKMFEYIPNVNKVIKSTKPRASDDCTTLMRRVVANGGQAAFINYGCNNNGHHKSDFEIQDTQSLPIGLYTITSFIYEMNNAKKPAKKLVKRA